MHPFKINTRRTQCALSVQACRFLMTRWQKVVAVSTSSISRVRKWKDTNTRTRQHTNTNTPMYPFLINTKSAVSSQCGVKGNTVSPCLHPAQSMPWHRAKTLKENEHSTLHTFVCWRPPKSNYPAEKRTMFQTSRFGVCFDHF